MSNDSALYNHANKKMNVTNDMLTYPIVVNFWDFNTTTIEKQRRGGGRE